MDDSRETQSPKAFVTGYPVRHSRSPLIHGYWLRQLGLAGSYRAHEVSAEDFPAFIGSLKERSGGFVGGNVTIPHKEAAFKLADRPDELSEELGASNTLWLEEGLLHATNTDGRGFTANLDERHPGWDRSERAVILGAGGASRAGALCSASPHSMAVSGGPRAGRVRGRCFVSASYLRASRRRRS